MEVAIRVDGSSRIGHGHVVRCLSLASALRDRGAVVTFIGGELDVDLVDRLTGAGFAVASLPGARGDAAFDAEDDASRSRDALAALGLTPEWIVVDHYGLDARWERAMRPTARGGLLVVDDLADRPHDCDLLLDQNLVEDAEARYAGLLPATATTLLGPRYALLHPDYRALHDEVGLRSGPVHRILVSFGGGDNDALASHAIDAILYLDRPDIIVDVVLGAASAQVAHVRRHVASHSSIRILDAVPSLAPLMAAADLAIGGAGTTSWERLCLGLPAVVVTVADNQVPSARALHDRGLIRWVGDVGPDVGARIGHVLREIVATGLDPAWSRTAAELVDGRGAERVAALMLGRKQVDIVARPAAPGDEDLLFAWVNDPAARATALQPAPIPLDMHQRWFRDRLHATEDCHLYIMELSDGAPLGQVRFDRAADAWRISYAVARDFRGRRLGRAMLQAALTRFREDVGEAVTFGEVKPDNAPSCRIFESLGFARREANGVVEFRRRA